MAPDYADVLVGVTTQSPSAIEVASQNASKVAAVIRALRALGLTEQQVTTSGYNLTQSYEYPRSHPPGASMEGQSMSAPAMAGGMIPTPINPGELNVIATVFTRWEFVPPR